MTSLQEEPVERLVPSADAEETKTAPSVSGASRAVFLSLAAGFFVLGALGAILPGLPTTPFLLLTSYFLARSSPRLNAALLRTRFLGGILRDWQQRRTVRRSVKLRAIAVVALLVGLSIYLIGFERPLAWLVLATAGVGITVIALLPEGK